MRRHEVKIEIQEPLPFQKEDIDDPHRFKIWRWGRRAGKTRGMNIVAAIGHGESGTDNWWPGLFNGGKVCWISRDNPQMEVIWNQEMKPRYKGRAGIHWREQDKIIEMEDGSGLLDLRSFENIDSVRGGDFDIILCDESAHWDLGYAWPKVIRPTLVDRKGSAIIASTTRIGSWFNELCERVKSGEMSKAWIESYRTCHDNILLDPDEIVDFIGDYPEGSIDLEQEVWAKLAVAGGLAFNEWREDIHVCHMVAPEGWTAVGCLDWGYATHGHFGLCFLGPDGEKFARKEVYFRELPPYDAGRRVGEMLKMFPRCDFIAADRQMWEQTDAVTVADYFQQGLRAELGDLMPPLLEAPKGQGSRVTRKLLMHEALKWKPNPDDASKPPPPWLMPRMRFHPDCHVSISTIPKLACDEKEPDKVKKCPDDHAFDSWTYLLNTITAPAQRPTRYESNPDIHPGFNERGRKRPPWMDQYADPERPQQRYSREG